MVITAIALILSGCSKEDAADIPEPEDPAVIWEKPEAIRYGTELGQSQLNASADVPGIFIYDPPAGTILLPGTKQLLSAIFRPEDSVRYNAVNVAVFIDVLGPATLSDTDGNIYGTVTLGRQVWMAENLKTTQLAHGTPILHEPKEDDWTSHDTPAYCWYENDSIVNGSLYGALYNWHTVETGKLCPSGWHVPDTAEWKELEEYLISAGYNYDGSLDANKIAKSMSASGHWGESTTEGSPGNTDYPEKTNASGFSALPGGRIDGQGPRGLTWEACFWTSSAHTGTISYARRVIATESGLIDFAMGNGVGFSVRCVMDEAGE